ncbi:hypothetical protein [Streptomyces sp. LN699]|uniref:hypothetical protein n=1 Tax=Streptomyces sp. LN699 TaxID=3112981 RepID=UPI0037249016
MARTRGVWNTKGTWAAAVALFAVLILTAYAMLGGDDAATDAQAPTKGAPSAGVSGPASPEATYAVPDDWTEPERWTALPRGQRTDERGSQVGFPHSLEGAAAMVVAANTVRIEGDRLAVDEQRRMYHSYFGQGDQSAGNLKTIEQGGNDTDKQLAGEMGIAAGQPLPSGAYVRSTAVGYKVVKKSGDEVSLWVLARVVQKTGETAKETSSYTRSVVGAQWQRGDWKLTTDALARALKDAEGQDEPTIAAPGDAAFNSGGWTAIREAS